MSNEIAISVRNVSKQYFLYENQRARLRHTFWPASTSGVSETWALRDFSFDVNKGDAVGIIGRNGSGKSTLLQIITKTLQPSTGSVSVNGRVAALLELGSGFHPEYTGRENVFFNGMLMGLSRPHMEERFDRIAAFADIGDVLDQPVKTYSSGMFVRLAFSVQIALDPDILIVDEALSVGDFFFRQKCYERIEQLRSRGMTLLFVTHDMNTVSNICNRALYLKKGELLLDGTSQRAIRAYLGQTVNPLPVASRRKPCQSTVSWENKDDVSGERGGLISVSVLDSEGDSVTTVPIGGTVLLQILFRPDPLREAHVYVHVKNMYNETMMTTGSYFLNLPIHELDSLQPAKLEFKIVMNVGGGEYSLQVITACPEPPNGVGSVISGSTKIGPISVGGDYAVERVPFLGPIGLPVNARIIEGSL